MRSLIDRFAFGPRRARDAARPFPAPQPNSGRAGSGVLAAIFLAAVLGWWIFSRPRPTDALVVYCAHDPSTAAEVLRAFEHETGIRVDVRYEGESKSEGLVQQLIRERSHPQCDVFWNNQVLTTLELRREGILEPYQGDGWQRMPDKYRDPEGYWVGFGARFRVFIVNTEQMEATKEAVAEAFTRDDLSRIAVAVPLFGTTLTHYTVLWREWGPTRLKEWHDESRRHGLREARGNGGVTSLVADGKCDAGWADTDDFFAAKGRSPIAMLPIRLAEGRTICMPDSVAIIRGTQRTEAARRLVDYLASAEAETALSKLSKSVPVGPVEPEALPEEVRPLLEWVKDGYDLNPLNGAHGDCLAWLKSLYAK